MVLHALFFNNKNKSPSKKLQEHGSNNPILVVESIVKKFGGLIALDHVSITVTKGTVTMLIGPNGSGKSTLLNIISGFLRPDKGRIIYNSTEITSMPPHKINMMGIARTFQTPKPFMNLTVLENLLVSARSNPGESFIGALRRSKWTKYEYKALEKAKLILKTLRLDHLWDEKSSNLSGGQLKLLEIGRALMNNANLILMDEPIAGVNPSLAHNIFDVIRELTKKQGITFLIVEHRLDIALKYVDYVYAMSRGRIIAEGLPEDVVKNPAVIDSYLAG